MAFTLLPATESDFVNREKLVQDIVNTLSNKKERIGYALYGKRRIGKTSIFKEVERRLKEINWTVPVYFSVWDLFQDTIDEFVKKFTVAILDGYSSKLTLKHKARNLLKFPLAILKEILGETSLTLKMRDEIEILLSFSRETKINYDELIENLFALPEHLAKETKTRCILLIDEFPSIMEFKNSAGKGIIRKIRTISEGLKATILCISGSIRKTMELVTISEVSPFYRQFIIKEVKPFSKENVEKLIIRNIGRKLNVEVIDRIYELSGGIPFYVQLLGKKMESTKESIAHQADVDKILKELLLEEGNILFNEEFNNLSPKERAIVFKMATEDINSPSSIAKALNSSPSNVSKFISYLEERGVVAKIERGIYTFEDHIFKLWLKEKYW